MLRTLQAHLCSKQDPDTDGAIHEYHAFICYHILCVFQIACGCISEKLPKKKKKNGGNFQTASLRDGAKLQASII